MIPDDTLLIVAREAEAHRAGNRGHDYLHVQSKRPANWEGSGMPCRPFCTKPLLEPVLVNCQLDSKATCKLPNALQWRHNECDGVSNHQPYDCILNRLFRYSQRKHQNSAPLAFVKGIHWWPVNSPHKGLVTRKMFPFDAVIMDSILWRSTFWKCRLPWVYQLTIRQNEFR